MIEILAGLPLFKRRLSKDGTDCLEEVDIVADAQSGSGGDSQGVGFGQIGNGLQQAGFAVFLSEDMLLGSWQEG